MKDILESSKNIPKERGILDDIHVSSKYMPRSGNSRQQDVTFLNNYNIIKDLGEGGYGKVKLAYNVSSNRLVALKFISKYKVSCGYQQERVRNEIRFLSILDHRNICKIFLAIEMPDTYVIEMEYIEGVELFTVLKDVKLDEFRARNIFSQLIDALNYLHTNRIIHRDIKPENIIINLKSDKITLIDFGFASIYDPLSTLDTFCGSPYYAAPEIVNSVRYTGPELDIWSTGIVLYTLLHRRCPFDGVDQKALYDNIRLGKFSMNKTLSNGCQDLMRKMICLDKDRRITIDGIIRHPWVARDFPSYIDNRQYTYSDHKIVAILHRFGFDDLRDLIVCDKSAIACFYRLINDKLLKGSDFVTLGNIFTYEQYIAHAYKCKLSKKGCSDLDLRNTRGIQQLSKRFTSMHAPNPPIRDTKEEYVQIGNTSIPSKRSKVLCGLKNMKGKSKIATDIIQSGYVRRMVEIPIQVASKVFYGICYQMEFDPQRQSSNSCRAIDRNSHSVIEILLNIIGGKFTMVTISLVTGNTAAFNRFTNNFFTYIAALRN